MRKNNRSPRSNLVHEALEPRWTLDGTGFAGNDCPPDLDLSAIETQTANVNQAITLDLQALGTLMTDIDSSGAATGDVIRLLLDPDDTAAGATMTEDGIFSWTPAADQRGSFEFTVIAVDDGTPALADAEVFVIEVVNQAPVVDLNGDDSGIDFSADFVEGGVAVAIVDTDLTVADGDGDLLSSATIRITNLADGDLESLSVDTAGTNITAAYDSITGTLQLSGDDTVTHYELVLRTLTYHNAAQNPDTLDRVIEITVSDGFDQSVPATSTVTISAVNDAPDLAEIPDGTATIGVLFEVIVTATDADGDNLTFILDTDEPGFPSGVTLVQQDNNTALISWTPSNGDGGGSFTLSVLVIDDGDLPLSDREVFMITVADEAPRVDLNGSDDDGTGSASTFTEDSGPVSIVDTDLTVADPNDANLESATVAIANLMDDVAEMLAVDTTDTGIVATYNTATGILSLTGTDTVANYEQVLRTLTYDNISQDPVTSDRIVNVTVSDGSHTSEIVTATVGMIAVDDAPELSLPAPFDDDTTPVELDLGQMITFAATATDVDTATADLTFSLDLSHSGISMGAVQPIITSPPASDPGGEFRWTPDEVGTFTITVVVTDSGGLSDQQTFLVNVTDPGTAAAAPSAAIIRDIVFGSPEDLEDEEEPSMRGGGGSQFWSHP